MYICTSCGEVKENLTDDIDCYCGGTYEEAIECAICGEWAAKCDCVDGVCEDCLRENATLDNAVKTGEIIAEAEGIINPLFGEILGTKRCAEILLNYVKKYVCVPQKIIEQFLNYQNYEFVRVLKEDKANECI